MKATIEDFQKLDIRVGLVLEVADIEGSDRLYRCVVDFGEEIGKRVIFSGIKKWYDKEALVGKLLPYVVNLEPKKMFGEESQGMLMAVLHKGENGEDAAVILEPNGQVSPGEKIV
jgi:methionine--tRNA ligase beta chain